MLAAKNMSNLIPLEAPLSTALSLLVIFSTIYGLGIAIHRLYFSPLAPFPGPKLAAVTGWYETYFEIVKNGGGHFTFEIMRMHEKYGQYT
jgi:hypothetical protein